MKRACYAPPGVCVGAVLQRCARDRRRRDPLAAWVVAGCLAGAAVFAALALL